MVETLEPVFEATNGWKRVYVDMPGHGLSPPQDDIESQDGLLAAVMRFAEETLPEGTFGIIGESRGSYIARGFVHVVPDRISGVALLVPGGSPSADPARLPAHATMEPDPTMVPELAEGDVGYFENIMVVQRRDILDKWRRSAAPARQLWSADQESRVGAAFDFSFHTKGETCQFDGPSLIIAGRQDRMSGHLDSVDLLPEFTRASLAVLDASGHGLAWERPELVSSLVADWLKRLRTAI